MDASKVGFEQRYPVISAAVQVTAILECCELYGALLGKLLGTRQTLLLQLQQQLTTQLSQPYMAGSKASQQQQTEMKLDCQHMMRHLEQQQQGQQMNADKRESRTPSCATAAAVAASSELHPWQLLDQLAANMQREHVLRSMLKCFVWGRILDSIQFAKAAVYSHPLFPDVHAIMCVLRKREQQRQAELQLRDG
jgi:hypothetical protein